MDHKTKFNPVVWGIALLLVAILAALIYWWQTREEPPVISQDNPAEISADSAKVETDEAISFAVKTINAERNTDYICTKVTVDFPVTNNKVLQEHIVDFIITTLTRDFTWGGNVRPTYKGDKTDGQAIVDFFVNDKVQEITTERRRDSIMNTDPWNEVIAIQKIDENENLVTYFVNFSGDHGGVGDGCLFGITFSKAEGHAVKVLKDPKDSHLKAFLTRYFEQHQSEDILSLYFPEELESHPVPIRPPYIMDNSVHFLYQKYEIGPGAMGFVEMAIPLVELSDYLSEDAKKLK